VSEGTSVGNPTQEEGNFVLYFLGNHLDLIPRRGECLFPCKFRAQEKLGRGKTKNGVFRLMRATLPSQFSLPQGTLREKEGGFIASLSDLGYRMIAKEVSSSRTSQG
jgi:hypothetical protein